VVSLPDISSDVITQCLHIQEYVDAEQCHTYPSENFIQTVGTSVTLLETVMAEMAHLSSVEQHVRAAIMNRVDWMFLGSVYSKTG
jgi:hypothetical protein